MSTATTFQLLSYEERAEFVGRDSDQAQNCRVQQKKRSWSGLASGPRHAGPFYQEIKVSGRSKETMGADVLLICLLAVKGGRVLATER